MTRNKASAIGTVTLKQKYRLQVEAFEETMNQYEAEWRC